MNFPILSVLVFLFAINECNLREIFNIMKLLRNLSLIVFFVSAFQVRAQVTSNLPIVIITTPGAITNTQSQGSIAIIDNISGTNTFTDPPTYTGMIGIKLRGNAAYAKKSYSIETWSAPTISLDTALMGMPSENDWVLLANYPDRTLLRADLAFYLHEKMGRYAPRMKHCEVVINNQYMGVYNFGEQIKKSTGRLDIAKLTVNDNFGHNMTGGYIWKIDGNGAGWQSAFTPPYAAAQTVNFEYDYPDNGDITNSQKAYIKSYVDSFENEMNAANFQDTINGWRKHGAVNSFIDFIIIQELSRNNEAYRQNTFFYKDKGTKMRPGPLWGFDLAWKNTANCNSSVDTGWCYNLGGVCPAETKLAPFWWNKLSTDTLFTRELKCRYSYFRQPGGVLDTVEIFKYIDSVKNRLGADSALIRNFVQWPIFGVPIVNEPTPMAADYNTEIANMKQFIKARIAWLDSKWPQPSNCAPAGLDDDAEMTDLVAVYPIPAHQQLNIDINDAQTKEYTLRLFNMQGNIILEQKSVQQKNALDISGIAKGIYFVQVKSGKGSLIKKVVIE